MDQERRELGERACAAEYYRSFEDSVGAVFRGVDADEVAVEDVEDWGDQLDALMRLDSAS